MMVYRKLRNVLDHHKASVGSLIREPNNVDNLSQLPPYCLALAALDELEGARAPCLIKDSLEKTDLETVSDTSGIRIRVDHMVDPSLPEELVRVGRLELPLPKKTDFESAASTDSATPASLQGR